MADYNVAMYVCRMYGEQIAREVGERSKFSEALNVTVITCPLTFWSQDLVLRKLRVKECCSYVCHPKLE
jgi:hypothetical protein